MKATFCLGCSPPPKPFWKACNLFAVYTYPAPKPVQGTTHKSITQLGACLTSTYNPC